MSTAADIVTAILLLTGTAFFVAGTLGLLRFPDFYTRLHAMTKADNVGLGFVVTGLAVQAPGWLVVGQLLLIWLLMLLAGASVGHLLGRAAWRRGTAPWRRPGDVREVEP